jgi:hypothetical protein
VTTSDFQNAPSSYASALDVSIEGEVKELPVGSAFAEMGATGLKRSSGIIDDFLVEGLFG